jgi:hypothetical protein
MTSKTKWPAIFRKHPEANDVDLAAILGCTPATVSLHRRAIGISARYGRTNRSPAKPLCIWTRVDNDEKAAIEAAALAAGVTVSAWVRDAIRERMESVQERMGAILDRAHEASGVVPRE